MTRLCRVPDCAAVLTRKNRSGVCSNHRHWHKWCGCEQCSTYSGFKPYYPQQDAPNPDAKYKPRISDSPNIKVVEVYAACGVSTSADRLHRISLPAAPWEIES